MRRSDEIWKPVLGFEGLYEVSSFGSVRNVKTGPALKMLKENLALIMFLMYATANASQLEVIAGVLRKYVIK